MDGLRAPDDRSERLRVLTWNVHDHRDDAAALERVLRTAAADVVCLQETARRPGSRARLRRLARRVGLRYVVGGRASAGTALLVGPRVLVHEQRARRLPVRGPLTRPRGAVEALLSLSGCAAVRVVGIHLGLDDAERRRHVALLLADAPPDRPLVVAGDLNEPPDGPSWRAFAPRVQDVGAQVDAPATFPARRPRVRIDALLVPAGLPVALYGAPPGVHAADVVAASDHAPVLAELVLPPAGPTQPV